MKQRVTAENSWREGLKEEAERNGCTASGNGWRVKRALKKKQRGLGLGTVAGLGL